MVAAGFIQIVIASLDILTTCSKRTRYLYFSITASILAVLLELAALIAALYILGEGTVVLAEDLLQPWFLWECVPHGTCENGLLYYINMFMMPQVGLTALAIVLHGLSILYLMKLFRAKKFHLSELLRAKERSSAGNQGELNEQQGNEEITHPGFAQAFSSDNNNPSADDKHSEGSDSDQADDGNDEIELLERRRGSQPDLVSRTPVSILKDPNCDSVVSRRTVTSVNTRKQAQSLTFSTNVEIHVMNSPKSPEETRYSSTAF